MLEPLWHGGGSTFTHPQFGISGYERLISCLGLWVEFPVSGDERLSGKQLGAGRSQSLVVDESVRGAHKGQKGKGGGKLHCQRSWMV